MKNHTQFIIRIRAGEPFESVLTEWGIGRAYALTLLRSAGIDTGAFRQRKTANKLSKSRENRSFSVLAELLKNTETADIIKKHNVSRQYIHQIRKQAEEAGIL